MVREDRHRAYEKDSSNEVQIYRDVRVVEDRRRVEGKHRKVRILHAGGAARMGTTVGQKRSRYLLLEDVAIKIGLPLRVELQGYAASGRSALKHF